MYINMNDFGASLFDELRRLEREMNTYGWPSPIRSAPRGEYPPINIGTHANRVDVYLFLPGVDASQLDINIQQNMLSIKGERRLIAEEGASYFRRERFDGAFRRVVNLPEDVDPEQVEALYKDGVLHIAIQRKEASKPRQIQVK
ncbi:MAG: Hsp20/alpha crystallin family protein [Gammaproteobacteria bacterium SHHR-1]|uniref:Hsp20/alpha crystallin family protein n=1 Tax=Magnetovirga frankeli TaxID=947516 RepID=UPI001293989D|nr:Hsp20/alpha crystallin family protein [gamma proteobacterium SS-5]